MSEGTKFEQVIAALDGNNQTYEVLQLQSDVQIIISQRGARVLGPFLTPDSESIFWLNPAWSDPAQFGKFLESGDWNLGGERNWIAPEIQYLVTDRTDFWGTVRVPAQMDPGEYSMESPTPGQYRLSQRLTLDAFNLAAGQKTLDMETLIQKADDPLRHLGSYATLIDGVTFAGYQQTVALSETTQDDVVSEVWNLVQLNPGGQLLIPCSPLVEHTNYYEPIDDDHQAIHANHIRLNITGDHRYKVGYKAAHVLGRLAYLNQLDDDRAYLIVRNFFNNPEAEYAEEPSHMPGQRGHSIHVYNDGGMFGGFGELECNGQTIGGATLRQASRDAFILWLYVGTVDRLKLIAQHLLGVEI